ncbi:dipeptidase [Sphingomonas sp.]|uniref:dipeptidase n=1 Tax=Sphingomonas sp. TaxID=28214 RepID=UPI0038A24295
MTIKAALLLTAAMLIASPATAQRIDARTQARIDRILKATPLIDGHNDIAEQLRENYGMKIEGLASGTDQWKPKPLMTDMARLHQGRVGAQFWSVYIPSEVTGDAAIRETIEQIDIVKRMVKAYPNDLALAGTADDIVRVHKTGRVASLIGIEGGHQIGGNLAALRQFYELGARYMTLTHFKNNEFADSATDDPKYHGINAFGRAVIHEMNRLGMLVDLSHVSPETMRDALKVTRAPVLFTHSDARALSDHPRNVPDDVLTLTAANGGVVMVNFYMGHLSEPYRQWSAAKAAEDARLKSLFVGQPERRDSAMKQWGSAHPAPTADVGLIADHIEHVAKVAGYDHVGIGGDLDGIDPDEAPAGMNSVSGYPLLFAELIRRGWSDANLAKLAGGNVLRVMRRAEAIAASMKNEPPSMATLSGQPGK